MGALKTGLALSVNQPWAWLTVNGHKDVENRKWRTQVRGIVAIHAGMKFDLDGYTWVARTFPKIKMPEPHVFECGGIVGVATLLDCTDVLDSPWFFGPWGFQWADAKPIEFMRCRGHLGFFRPDLTRALERAARKPPMWTKR